MTLSRRLQLDAPLVWTTLALTCAIALHAAHLPLWVMATYVLLLVWRGLLGLRGARLPSGWLRVLVVATVLLGVLATFRTVNGLSAGTAMLTLMAGVKLLETRRPRDHVVLLLIGYFLVLAAFLHAQLLWLLPVYAAILWLTTTALMRATQAVQTQTPRESVRYAARLLLQAAPLMLLMFAFFPRVPGPFWALPNSGGAVTGLGDEMSPGDISELSLQSTVAFRVRFDGAAPPPSQRYWRGPVLHDFDGYTWRRNRAITHPRATPRFSGQAFGYSLMLEPSGRPWIFALDLPETWRAHLFQSYDYQLLAREPVDQPTTIALSSRTIYGFNEPLSFSMRLRDTRLPEAPNPRARALARRMRANAANQARYIGAVLQMFRDQEFFYTLTPPRLDLDSVDDFLFNTRSGFCGHFASAFTTLMRAAGIPARVVTGYQGGELNRLAGYYIVRQSDAHAWSEVWLEGRGWVRVDPTAAVAPQRIEGGLMDALGADEPVADRFVRGSRWLAEIRFAWDAVNTLWRERILQFNGASQIALLEWLGLGRTDWRALTTLLAASVVVAMSLLALHLRRAMRGARADPIHELYQRFCRKMQRHGMRRNEHEGALDFARRVARERPDLATTTDAITRAYLELRYGGVPLNDGLQGLKRSVRAFR